MPGQGLAHSSIINPADLAATKDCYMRDFLSMLGYAIVACAFFIVYFISPRWYAIMACGLVVYACSILITHIYPEYFRLLNMKCKSLMKKFRQRYKLPDFGVSMGIGR